MSANPKKKWYERIPHPVIMLFSIIVFTAVLSYILPAGAYERELIEGRERVVPGSYQQIASTPLGIIMLVSWLVLLFSVYIAWGPI